MECSHFMKWSKMWGERNPLSIGKDPICFIVDKEVEDVTAEDT